MQVVKSLRLAGLSGVGLKWPNDVLLDNGKLSGILIEMGATSRGRVEVVIGIGVNLQLDESEASEIDQPWSSAGEARTISRNQLVSLLLSNLISELNHYSISGFERYKSSWDEFNVYSDCPVQILIGDKVIEGIDRGVDEGGNLILETSQGLRTFNAGEVSLRALR